MKFFKNLSFWKKLLLMGVIPLALLGIVVGALSYLQAERVVKQSEKRVLSDTINRIDININVKVRQINSFMQAVTASLPVSRLIDWHSSGALQNFDTAELHSFCSSTFGAFSEVERVNIFMGDALIYQDGGDVPIVEDAQRAELYAEAERYANKVIWSNLKEQNAPSENSAALKQLLIYEGLANERGETVGLIVLELNPNTLGSAILTKQKILSHQTTFITDRAGSIVYSDNSIQNGWLAPILQSYRNGERKSVLWLGGESYYVCSQYNGLTGWITFTLIREDRLFPDSLLLGRYIIMLVMISLLLAATCLLIFSIAVTKPLGRLMEGMKEVQDTNFELQLENDRGDEIGELTDTFNYMVNRIRILVNQVYQERLAQKNAEIEALQAQINPHFLYNALDSINWMLIDRNAMDISAIVVALGKLMQYTMNTSASMATLKEEYANVRDYLLIQKNRLEEKLEFTLQLEPSLEEFPVPKLILQPLVENAIDHGIKSHTGVGKIAVTASRQEGRIRIKVTDNGEGMNEEQLYQYRQLLASATGGHTSIGVRNVARRLQLFFNYRCEFHVDSKPKEGMSITILILTEE